MQKNEPVCPGKSNESFNAEILNAVLSVPGVAKVTKCTATNATVSPPSKDKSEYDLELRLAIEYGSSIPAVHENIRKRLREDIQAATGLQVKKLDLCIDGIYNLLNE